MSHTTPQIGDTRPAPGDPDRLEEVRAYGDRWQRRAKAAEAERDALRAEIGPLRRQAALWRAGIKPGTAADLFLDRLPDDVDVTDDAAVRQACAEITAAVLGARDELAEVARERRSDRLALETGIARAREHRANVERADELALRLVAREAGVPVEHPVASLFLRQYDGLADADHVTAAWHRQVLDREPPADVIARLASRERDARLERYRQALEQQEIE
jgi:hypothetical protein